MQNLYYTLSISMTLFKFEFQLWQKWEIRYDYTGTLQHLNAAAEGKRAPGPVLHLARDSLLDKTDPSTYQLAKVSFVSVYIIIQMSPSDLEMCLKATSFFLSVFATIPSVTIYSNSKWP